MKRIKEECLGMVLTNGAVGRVVIDNDKPHAYYEKMGITFIFEEVEEVEVETGLEEVIKIVKKAKKAKKDTND